MSKTTWFLKQLLPLTYVSTYAEHGAKKLTIFKMWFGKCYKVRNYELKQH